MARTVGVDVEPITNADVTTVAAFLHAQLNNRVSQASWAAAIVPPWPVDAPNHGFLLRTPEGIVGVYVAFYADRVIAGRVERFCNLGAWCVVDAFRAHSVRLLRALLAQPGYHFTDLSPSGAVVPLNQRLKFSSLDTTTALVPNLPWPSRFRRIRVTSDPDTLAQRLTAEDLEIYCHHRATTAAIHLLVTRGEENCYLILRRDRRKKLPVFVSIVHVGNRELFREVSSAVFGHLLLRQRALATLAELRVVGDRPHRSVMLQSPRPRMYRSDLEARHIDYLYSELTCVAW